MSRQYRSVTLNYSVAWPNGQSRASSQELLTAPDDDDLSAPTALMIAPICISCSASGLDLRQTIPMVRLGLGLGKRSIDRFAERVSSATAISGNRVSPIPAPTICASVDSELPSMICRGLLAPNWQNDSA